MPAEFKEDLSSPAAEMKASFKKIKAGNGKLTGNFYVVARPGKAYAICVTISARDPKGNTVAQKGRAARKEIKGGKFGRGLIEWDADKKKFIFRLASGSLASTLLKKTVQTEFAKSVSGFAFLKGALFTSGAAEAVVPEEEETSKEEVEELDVSDLDDGDVKKLLASQPELSKATNSLSTFLSEQETAVEIAEQFADLLSDLEAAEESGDEAAIEEAKTVLLEAQSSGQDYFATHPTPGFAPKVVQVAMERAKSGDQNRLVEQWNTLGQRADELQKSLEEASPEKIDDLVQQALDMTFIAENLNQQMRAFD
jgi:hypothetical protein